MLPLLYLVAVVKDLGTTVKDAAVAAVTAPVVGPVVAAPPVLDPSAPGFVTQIVDAVNAHRWNIVTVLAVIGAVYLLRQVTPKLHGKLGAWLNTNRGGAVLALVSGAAAAVAKSLLSDVKLNPTVVVSSLAFAVAAIGGWNGFWDLFFPADKPAAPAVPAPLDPPIKAAMFLPILFFFGVSVGLSGCQYCKVPANQDTARCKVEKVITQCGLPGVVKVVEQIFPEVVAALASNDWSKLLDNVVATLQGKGVSDAVTAVTCAVASADINLATAKGAALPPHLAAIREHAQAWRAAHPVGAATVTVVK